VPDKSGRAARRKEIPMTTKDAGFVPTWTEVLAAQTIVLIADRHGLPTDPWERMIATWPEDHPGVPLTPED